MQRNPVGQPAHRITMQREGTSQEDFLEVVAPGLAFKGRTELSRFKEKDPFQRWDTTWIKQEAQNNVIREGNWRQFRFVMV